MVLTVGNLLEVVVHAADIQDRDGAKLVLEKLPQVTKEHLQRIWADGACRGKLVDWVLEHLNAILDIVEIGNEKAEVKAEVGIEDKETRAGLAMSVARQPG